MCSLTVVITILLYFFDLSVQPRKTKAKNRQMELHQTKKGLTQQGKPLTDKKGNLLKGRRYLQRLYKLRD